MLQWVYLHGKALLEIVIVVDGLLNNIETRLEI
jgi:hypothetical protein